MIPQLWLIKEHIKGILSNTDSCNSQQKNSNIDFYTSLTYITHEPQDERTRAYQLSLSFGIMYIIRN